MAALVDLTGQRFGRLLVLKRGENTTRGLARWLCQCDCGRQTTVIGASLRYGSVKSCGCSHVKPNGQARRNEVIQKYRKKADKAGLEFTLSDDEMIQLMAEPCFYCGAPPSNHRPGKGRAEGFTYSGLDRVDNSKGYTAEKHRAVL